LMDTLTKSYVATVAALGLGGLLFGLANPPRPEHIGTLLFLVILCGLTQAAAVPLFSDSSVSLAFAVSFVAMLLFGASGAIATNLVAAIVHSVYPRRRQWYKSVFNASVLTVSATAASLAFSLAGGGWPAKDLLSNVAPAIVAALVYYVVNTASVALAVSLTSKKTFLAVFNLNHRWLVFHHLTVAVISLLAPYAYQSFGLLGLVAFLLPLVLPWMSTTMYLSQAKAALAGSSEAGARSH
jgi:hypothetical protein